MGCVSSKHARKNLKRQLAFSNGCVSSHHVVSLTSSTYGLLELEVESPKCDKKCVIEVIKKSSPPHEEPAEEINAWELMEDLDETEIPCLVQSKKTTKARVFLDPRRSPLKFLNQTASSPKKLKRFRGKENNAKTESSPKLKCDGVGPLFDPELIEYFEKELSEEAERKKKTFSLFPISRKSRNLSKNAAEEILGNFEKMPPPGGENGVVLYTTTLRGIRKTFEDCNTARSILESHDVQMFERDISMHSGFREELRGLMGNKREVRVPVVFVKGRLIGGADEVVKLEEEGKLGILLAGISRAAGGCAACGGFRFVLCLECHGSCKVWGENGNSVKCGECNENGLVQCHICCC